MYLKAVWGLDQSLIGEIEGVSQSQVSKLILQAKKENTKVPFIEFAPEEIKYLQFLPREILTDTQVVAFVTNILGVDVEHPFFQFFGQYENVRMAALSSLDIQNKRLQQIFNKAQSSVSMAIQRNIKKAASLERPNRYEDRFEYLIKQCRSITPSTPVPPAIPKHKFFVVGGND